MRRKIVFSLAAILLSLGIFSWIYHKLASQGEAGYVIIGMGNWSVETTLLFAVGLLAVLFGLLYLLTRSILKAVSLPTTLKSRETQQKRKRSQDALAAGLIQTVEGNWEKAERSLIRHVADSGAPLINYLTAAKAAHSRGAIQQRDEYLKLAHKSAPEAELAIGLTKAELQIANKQFEHALESLTQLQKLAPTHAAVLRLTHEAYAKMEDWESLNRIIPDLHRHKVLMEADITKLEKDTYLALLTKKAVREDITGLREIWRRIPPHLQAETQINSIYFAAMIKAGVGNEVEKDLRIALGRGWSEPLLILYGCIKTDDPLKHLETAETWLAPHPDDPILLSLLGKLSIQAGQIEKGREYLLTSLEQEPSVEAYHKLGDLLKSEGKYQEATVMYQKGLLLASDQVVTQMEEEDALTV